MFKTLFMFKGRLNRLQYCLAGILITLLSIAFAVFGFVILDRSEQAGSILPLLLLAFLMIWMAFSLQAARIRDIGLSPIPVLLGMVAVFVLLSVGEQLADDEGLRSLCANASLALQVVSSLLLMLTPGDGGTHDDSASATSVRENAAVRRQMPPDGTPQRSRPIAQNPRPLAPPSAITPVSLRSAAGARPTFGRRGL